jgi:hypothetical protein
MFDSKYKIGVAGLCQRLNEWMSVSFLCSALRKHPTTNENEQYVVITNDVSDYIDLFVRIAHSICNQPLYLIAQYR